MAFEFTDSNFEEKVLQASTPVVVDFWAAWCGPCKMLTPIIENVANKMEGKALVGKLNVDENPIIAAKYGIRSIPTVLFFKNGEEVDKNIGVASEEVYIKKIETLL